MKKTGRPKKDEVKANKNKVYDNQIIPIMITE